MNIKAVVIGIDGQIAKRSSGIDTEESIDTFSEDFYSVKITLIYNDFFSDSSNFKKGLHQVKR